MTTLPKLLFFGAIAAAFVGQSAAQPAASQTKSVLPSILIDVSAKILNEIVNRPVDRVEPMREIIFDAQVFGIGRTRGKVGVQLHSKAEYALLELVFQGKSFSQFAGYDEPIIAYTDTVVTFDVRKTIAIDSRGVHGYPARAQGKACTWLVGMTNFQGEKEVTSVDLGKRRFVLQKAEIEAEVARKAECKLAIGFDKDTCGPILQANQALVEAKAQLARFGLPLPALQWSTSTSQLQARAHFVDVTPALPPPEMAEACDVTVRVHQSILQNFSQRNLGGKTLSIFELAARGESVFGPLLGTKGAVEQLNQLFKLLGVEPLMITFDRGEPLSIHFANDGFTVTLHGAAFQSGAKTYASHDIRAAYKLEKTETGFAAKRQGPPEVAGRGTIDEKDPVALTMLRSTFNFLFIDRLDLGEMTIPIEEKTLIVAPVRAELRQGWLQLCLMRKGQMPEKK